MLSIVFVFPHLYLYTLGIECTPYSTGTRVRYPVSYGSDIC